MSSGNEELQAVVQGFPALVSKGFRVKRLARSSEGHVFRLQFGHADLKSPIGLDVSRITGVGLEAHAVREEVGTNLLAGTLTFTYGGTYTALLPFDASADFIELRIRSSA